MGLWKIINEISEAEASNVKNDAKVRRSIPSVSVHRVTEGRNQTNDEDV